MLKLSQVSKSFDDRSLLRNISFEIKRGERVSFLSPGGAGKSTLLKILLGLIKPDGGDVELLGHSVFSIVEKKRLNLMRRVGVAFQQEALFDFMTVMNNILFAMEHMTNKSKKDMHSRCQELLKEVKLPNAHNLFPYELSGGMKRRVGVARALCTDPEIAFLMNPLQV